MVGPVSDEERNAVTLQVKLAMVALVGLSAGLVTLQGDPSPAIIVGAVAGGLAVGALLVWYVFPGNLSPLSGQNRR